MTRSRGERHWGIWEVAEEIQVFNRPLKISRMRYRREQKGRGQEIKSYWPLCCPLVSLKVGTQGRQVCIVKRKVYEKGTGQLS